jgi:serine/threonine protein phosphatase PrpC
LEYFIFEVFFACDDILLDKNTGLFGVLDGHGGIHVVDYCRREIPRVNLY